ncbi:MAG: hypothetical protein JNL52_08740 [Flavobacteriales bacterium]|nr:hypothetical protein [Flavobacteriales bacterium]
MVSFVAVLHALPYVPLLLRPLVFLTIFMASQAWAQEPARMSEAAAKEAVYLIVQHSGLLPTFTVREDPSVRTAVAYIKGRDRIIAYDPVFIGRVLDSTRTDWAAVSILAHEIAHHLLGHTLDPDAVHPGDELACDRYSGFVLQRMGATLEESRAAMEVAGSVHGTHRHPPRHARLQAIEQGWKEARDLTEQRSTPTFRVDRDLRFVVRFVGDANTYYVDAAGCLVWFNNVAAPIGFGACDRLPQGPYTHAITWEELYLLVDGKGAIWRTGVNGLQRQVGSMQPFAASKP